MKKRQRAPHTPYRETKSRSRFPRACSASTKMGTPSAALADATAAYSCFLMMVSTQTGGPPRALCLQS
jgi:hypothetical protein